jgi:hypothetical protein
MLEVQFWRQSETLLKGQGSHDLHISLRSTRPTCIRTERFERIVYSILTLILLVVLYWCKTWSVTLMEEHRLRVLENRKFRDDLWA